MTKRPENHVVNVIAKVSVTVFPLFNKELPEASHAAILIAHDAGLASIYRSKVWPSVWSDK